MTYALRDRGLMTVSKSGRDAHAEVTETDRFHLRHGRRPEDPVLADDGVQVVSVGPSAPMNGGDRREVTGQRYSPTPYSERPIERARRAKAQELVDRLFAEGRFLLADPDDDEVADWRRAVDYVKRHGLEPQGRHIERARFGTLGLEIFLADGPHPNLRVSSRKPTRRWLRTPHESVPSILLWLPSKTMTDSWSFLLCSVAGHS
ncbi:hypothetical protein [Streptomyces celluloflavus]|uniref:hypothetical protein n=1 Tax=Streptomyces celluloflavus TaxID=58344 RepID=UPI0036B1E311